MSHGDTHHTSKKISGLIGTETIADTALVTIVANGTNLKTTFGAFKAALGALGTLTQIGAVTGAPVLQVDGKNFAIRNLEAGSGTIPALTASNGVKIDLNLNSGAAPVAIGVGVPILTKIGEPSPVIRSLIASTGIAIFANNGSITISATGALPTTGVVIVNSVSDLPLPVGDSITLEAGTTYSFQGLIDISPYRLVINTQGVALVSDNRITRGFFSDNVNALFTVSGFNVVPIIREMSINSPNGSVLDVQAGSGLVFNNVVTFNSAKVSTITDSVNVSFRNYTVVNVGLTVKGVQWFGACTEFNASNGLFLDWDDTMFDFGTATFSNGISLGPSIRFDASTPKIALKGLAANIVSGALGQVFHNKFLGSATVSSGFDEHTLGWEFIGNQGINDTSADSLSVNTAGTTVTIALVNVGVKIGGTWVDDNSSQFTVDGSGRVTYNGLQNLHAPIDLSVSADPVSGTNKDFSVCVAINGTLIPDSSVPARAASGDRIAVSVPWQHEFQTGDFVEAFLENNSDTTNFNITRALIRVN